VPPGSPGLIIAEIEQLAAESSMVIRRALQVVLPALVALASNVAQSQPRLAEWRIAPAPALTLADNGTPATEFHRIAGAWRLPNGNVVVANGGTMELRVFDSRGSLVETVGRRGGGPGEFEAMRVIDIVADTAIIYDRTARRATTIHFGVKGRVVSTVTMTAAGAGSGFDVTGRLSDGRWVATISMGTPLGWDAPKGVHRVKGVVGFVARAGDGTTQPVAELESMASITHMPGADKSKWRTGPAAFSPWYRGEVSAGVLWIGETGSDSLQRIDARGTRRKVTLPLAAAPLTPQLIASAKEAELKTELRFGATGFTEFKYSAENLPARLPFYSSLTPGADGEIWVREYSADAAAPARFVILDAQGRAIARVATPAGFRGTHVGRDFIVGITTDADGVEGVKVLRLERR
jgi:hypothetical protein